MLSLKLLKDKAPKVDEQLSDKDFFFLSLLIYRGWEKMDRKRYGNQEALNPCPPTIQLKII